MASFEYPSVFRSDHQDILHGRVIADPYRWLEDPDSPETDAFVAAQNECSAKVFANVPYRDEFLARNTEMFNYAKYSAPAKHGERYFFYKNDGLQNQAVLYMQDSLTSEPTVLLDPNTLAEDGTSALSGRSFSEAKTDSGMLYFAYGVSKGGSDWQTVNVLAIHSDGTIKHLDDTLEWVKFSSFAWTHDDKGFFYSRYPTPKTLKGAGEDKSHGTETDLNENQQIWYHRIGTPQSEDRLVFAYPEKPKYYLGSEVSEDGQYLLVTISDGCKNANMVHIAPISDFESFLLTDDVDLQFHKLVDNMDFSYNYLFNNDKELFFLTNLNAPRNRVVKVTDYTAQELVWEEVIPEPEGTIVLEAALPVRQDMLICTFMKDASSLVSIYTQSGEYVRDIVLPSIGSASVSCKRTSPELFFYFTSFLYPGTIYREDLTDPSTSTPTVFRESTVPGFSPEGFEAKQVWYTSKDGTPIPMFLISKDLPRDGNNPVYLYGYGGFNISLTPYFSAARTVFMQHFNGIIALPSLRGGGEYGEEWHQAGTFGNKQNVFDDFHSAAEYLIAEGYTKPSKIAIHGGSNGGLLVAAAANQRPDLFGCAVGAVGVMDMLRFHKFTVGHGWTTDYGNPDEPEAFEYLIKYSPVHNVPSFEDHPVSPLLENGHGGYPATLLTTGDHDDRVVPLHSLKLIAELQYRLGSHPNQKNPLLIRIETKAGHGAGKPTKKILEEAADVYAYMGWALGATFTA
ncbi:prolyl endopeptidase [Thraustotheca clavata]|uniref:Prolyl endopeptidase n=1 Tax=Thraustotheca clavata TaxID=74557 RepID=A0A1W0AAF3_9STRA|nr:prolyl endopeptidase [Thraustotheca clavata]